MHGSIKMQNGGKSTAFFREAVQAAQGVVATSNQTKDFYYNIGGFPVCMHFTGPALVEGLTPALAHLATSRTTPALTIYVWDTASTGVGMPPPPWSERDYSTRTEIRGYSDKRYHTAYDVYAGTLRMLDKEENVAIFWTRNATTLPTYERGAPFRSILSWWMRERGRQYVHAAAVGTTKSSVLLAGKSGSGKSTTSTLCLAAGMRYLSDDYCLVATESAPRVYSLYNSVKLSHANLRQHAAVLEPLISNTEELATEKALIYLNQHYPEQIVHSLPIRAILIPSVTGDATTTLRRATPVAALMALAPSTIMQLSGTGSETLRAMSHFVQQLPSYHLDLGADMAQIPRIIHKLLGDAH